jgi:hypothetical protein
MLVSHRFRFIYTKTAKTGGTSVESYFERYCMPEGAWSESHARDVHESPEGVIGRRGACDGQPVRWWNHMPATDIRREVGHAMWDAYFKFCVIRNPFEKAVSAFYFRRKQDPTKHDSALAEQVQFERWLEAEGPYTDEAQYIIDGKFALDATIRHERMAEDMTNICTRLGVAWEPERMPTFKAGIRPKDATVAALYTPKSRRLVEHVCARELAMFGYEFPR